MTSAADQQLPPRTQAALQYLRRLKPLDGYAVERYLATCGKQQVRLKRRNVPIHDEGFEEIVVDGSEGYVVGIQVVASRGSVGRGILLVDKNGKIGDGTTVTVQMADVSTSIDAGVSRGSTARGSSSSFVPGSNRSGGRSSAAAGTPLSDANNELLVQYGLMALGALVVLKILSAAVNILSVLLVPSVYFYCTTNCPSIDTFDAKRELKRVMRGAHLPRERQPKGFFEQGLNRLAASVTAELATSLGYETTMTDFFGAARMAAVRVPVADAEYRWIGVVGKWRYIGQREIPANRNDS